MRLKLVVVAIGSVAIIACEKKNQPPAPVVGQPPAGERVTGVERLGWDQLAADSGELATLRYAFYVDGARSEAVDVSCAGAASAAGFACSARLPAMSVGAHTVELAAFTSDGTILESPRSAPLQLNVVSPAAAGQPQELVWPDGPVVETASRMSLGLVLVADGLDHPTDLAFAPDGRVFIAERSGRVRIVRNGRLLEDPALASTDGMALLSLALDPDFSRTHFVYTIGVMRSKAGGATFTLARFREAAGSLADRATLLDGIHASPTGATASLRFGTDGKLYAAFDDGGDRRLGGDLASPNGKVLRMNPDGTTPADQAGATPLYSFAFHSPRGFDWDPKSGALWVADVESAAAARLSVVTSIAGGEKRGVVRGAYALTPSTIPSSVAFYRGRLIPEFRNDLFVATEEGRHLLRIRIDPNDATRVVATERVLQDRIGGLRVVASGPDGAIYVCTERAMGRLEPIKSSVASRQSSVTRD